MSTFMANDPQKPAVGMTEQNVCIGDRYRIGDAVVVEVSQPRQPCWKLGVTAGVREIPARMQEHAATGWYYRVLSEGSIKAGDSIRLELRPMPDWSLSRIILGFYRTPLDTTFLESLTEMSVLASEWRDIAERRLATGTVEDWSRRLYR